MAFRSTFRRTGTVKDNRPSRPSKVSILLYYIDMGQFYYESDLWKESTQICPKFLSGVSGAYMMLPCTHSTSASSSSTKLWNCVRIGVIDLRMYQPSALAMRCSTSPGRDLTFPACNTCKTKYYGWVQLPELPPGLCASRPAVVRLVQLGQSGKLVLACSEFGLRRQM